MVAAAPPTISTVTELQISSEAFSNEGFIPEKYTCDGDNINPPLLISNIPPDTKTLVVICEDPDAPIRSWTHWLVWNITPTSRIQENSTPGICGMNDFRQRKYSGPCPVSGTHRYIFKVFALNQYLYLPANTSQYILEKRMNHAIIGYGELKGFYSRK